MTLLDFHLRALRYPHPVDLSNPESARKLVIWLENLKIREYKIEDRKALSDIQSATWDAAFRKYLSDLECPLPPSAELRAALEWLVAFALNLEYEDNADKLRAASGAAAASAPAAPAACASAAGRPDGAAAAAPPARPAASASGRTEEEPFTDLQDPRVVAAVERLLRAVALPPPDGDGKAPAGDGGGGGGSGGGGSGGGGGDDVVARLQVAVERLVCGVGPALATGGWGAGRPVRQALSEVPLGFDLGDETLATAATVLRLLYIRDLRRLQTQIDHAVVEMQEYTANPKTDSSLGKVGR